MEQCSDFPARLVIIEKSQNPQTAHPVYKRNSIIIHSQTDLNEYLLTCTNPNFQSILFQKFNRFGPFELNGINYGSFVFHGLIIEPLCSQATLSRNGHQILEGQSEISQLILQLPWLRA